LIVDIRELGVPEIALTTNAQRLSSLALALKEAGLQRINISLDSLNPSTFSRVTRGGRLDRTLDGIHTALDTGLTPIKLNMVVMRGVNDHEALDMLGFGLETGCHVRFLELMPIGVAALSFEEQFVSTAETRSSLDEGDFRWETLEHDTRETSRDYLVHDKQGRSTLCGFISPTSQPFCDGCDRLRISADGKLHGCLARKSDYDLRPLLQFADEGEAICELKELMQKAFARKTGNRKFDGVASMAAIGG
jgi:cyclic pyranopterin phosphate synthase